MKHRIETFTTLLLFFVILLAGCSGRGQDMPRESADPFNQAAYGPVAAGSREPVELPPYVEPSFERLIEQFKTDVASNRGNAEVLQRKKQAIATPKLLWRPYFAVPQKSIFDPDLSIAEINWTRGKVKILNHDQRGESLRFTPEGVPSIPVDTEFEFAGEVFYTTKEQEDRIDALPTTLSEKVREQKRLEILFEGIDAFTAAKYLMDTDMRETFGLEYARRAIQKHPNSVTAMHVWVRCHPKDQRIQAYQELLKKFPNAAFAHEGIARHYLYDLNNAAIALQHIQIAGQLDSRITKKNALLAKCYAKLGQWEQSVAAYQGLSWIQSDPYSPSLDGLEKAQDKVYTQHTGYSYFSNPWQPEYVYDEKTRKLVIDKSKGNNDETSD